MRKEQLRALHVPLSKNPKFVARVEAYLRRCHICAVRGLTRTELRQRVQTGLQRAETYGLRTERASVAFLSLMFELGPNFDVHPAFAQLLQAECQYYDDEQSYIDRLLEETTDEDWNEAWADHEPSAWRREGRPPNREP